MNQTDDSRCDAQPVENGAHKETGQHAGARKIKATTFSAVDLMAMKLSEPRWAIKDIIPEGQTMLVGNPKLGKSWMALGFSVAVASGGYALGTIPVEAGDVHYLALEDNTRRLQDRLRKMLNGSPIPKRLTLSIEWPRLDKGGVEKLEEWIIEHPDARLIIIDTFKKVRPNRSRRADLYSEDYEHVEMLKDLADKHGVAVVAIHHANKVGATGDPLEAVSGTYGLSGAADSILLLHRERGQHDATLTITGRDVKDKEMALKWNEDICSWTALGDAKEYRISKDRLKVIAFLEEVGEAEINDIGNALGKHMEKENEAGLVRQLLSRMSRAGQIKALGNGKYTSISHTCHSSHTETTEQEQASNDKEENKPGLHLVPLNTDSNCESTTPTEVEQARNYPEPEYDLDRESAKDLGLNLSILKPEDYQSIGEFRRWFFRQSFARPLSPWVYEYYYPQWQQECENNPTQSEGETDVTPVTDRGNEHTPGLPEHRDNGVLNAA